MATRTPLWLRFALLVVALLAAPAVPAQVVVNIVGNTANATIDLANGANLYHANVTIVFDTPVNLTPENLNLSAQLIDPNDPAIVARLPAGITIDPNFPMLVTIEPPNLGWLFFSGFEVGENGSGGLSFRNNYQIEVHTGNLVYTMNSPYRLLKAPVGGNFADVTEDIWPGSTRARGRGGAFSQFVVGKDSQLPLVVALTKLLALDTRLVTAVLNSALRLQLVTLLAQVNTALLTPLLGCTGALAPLDQFLATVQANAGTNIANVWRAQRDVVNDAGELESLAYTLQFSLLGCSN